jgi:O-acetyl-ADP-ribose deacetylase (regulator of RNase III)
MPRPSLAKIPVIKQSVLNVKATIVVNAANELMANGGGSNGAILSQAGASNVLRYNNGWGGALASKIPDPNYARYTDAFPLMRTYKRDGVAWERSTVLPSPGFGTNAETILHSVGPDFNRARTVAEVAEMYDQLRKTYDNIYNTVALVSPGSLVTLAILPISGGIYKGTQKANDIFAVMIEKAKQYRQTYPFIKTIICLFSTNEYNRMRIRAGHDEDFELFDTYDAYAVAQNI